jgi:hypothetical protein
LQGLVAGYFAVGVEVVLAEYFCGHVGELVADVAGEEGVEPLHGVGGALGVDEGAVVVLLSGLYDLVVELGEQQAGVRGVVVLYC